MSSGALSRTREPSDWFAAWCDYHARIFGLGENGLTTALSWARIRDLAGWTEAELYDATEWLAANAPPTFLNEHLEAIRARLATTRGVFAPSRDNPTVPDLGECTLCYSTGRAVVPHLSFVRGSVWLPCARTGAYYTVAVSCRCPLGQWFASRVHPDRRWKSLSDYEIVNPNWDEQIKLREAEQHEAARLQPSPPSDGLQAVMAKLVERFAGVDA